MKKTILVVISIFLCCCMVSCNAENIGTTTTGKATNNEYTSATDTDDIEINNPSFQTKYNSSSIISSDTGILMLSQDGEVKKIINGKCRYMVVYNDKLYYCSNDDFSTHCFDFKENKDSILMSEYAASLSIANDKIYYTDGYNIYTYDLNEKKVTQVYEGTNKDNSYTDMSIHLIVDNEKIIFTQFVGNSSGNQVSLCELNQSNNAVQNICSFDIGKNADVCKLVKYNDNVYVQSVVHSESGAEYKLSVIQNGKEKSSTFNDANWCIYKNEIYSLKIADGKLVCNKYDLFGTAEKKTFSVNTTIQEISEFGIADNKIYVKDDKLFMCNLDGSNVTELK